MNITKENLETIKTLIKEYSAHDLEAFENRTEMFRMMMMLVKKLEEVL